MKTIYAFVVMFLATLGVAGSASAAPLEYNREVRPILSNKCFKCHGPDAGARKARLRLDVRTEATVEHRSGFTPIIPGRPDQSEVVVRIEETDEDERMPPVESNLTLSPQEKAVLRRWIEEGADYQPHWSLVPPRAAALPGVKHAGWARNGIDRFVLSRLEAEKLAPSKEADRATLLRRVSLDLTGLPPTIGAARPSISGSAAHDATHETSASETSERRNS